MTQKWPIDTRPGHLISRASKLLLRYGDTKLRDFGLGTAAFPVLTMLRNGESRSQKDLALCAKIEQPSMAQLLVRLERDGIIARTSDPSDGRSSLISLTEKALSLLPAIDACVDEANDRAVAGMSAAEVAALTNLLHRMVANLEAVSQD